MMPYALPPPSASHAPYLCLAAQAVAVAMDRLALASMPFSFFYSLASATLLVCKYFPCPQGGTCQDRGGPVQDAASARAAAGGVSDQGARLHKRQADTRAGGCDLVVGRAHGAHRGEEGRAPGGAGVPPVGDRRYGRDRDAPQEVLRQGARGRGGHRLAGPQLQCHARRRVRCAFESFHISSSAIAFVRSFVCSRAAAFLSGTTSWLKLWLSPSFSCSIAILRPQARNPLSPLALRAESRNSQQSKY